ncbi:hypothetical protein AAMO2058_001625600 [Amorphochlora amoebiformis]
MREPGEEELEDTTEALCAKEAGRIKLQGNYELKGYLKDIKCGHSMSRMAVSSEAGVIFVADPSGGVAVGLLDEKFAQNFISLSKKEKDGGVGADGFTRGLLADQRFSAVELSPDGRILGCLGRRNLVLLNVRYVLELVSERKASKNMKLLELKFTEEDGPVAMSWSLSDSLRLALLYASGKVELVTHLSRKTVHLESDGKAISLGFSTPTKLAVGLDTGSLLILEGEDLGEKARMLLPEEVKGWKPTGIAWTSPNDLIVQVIDQENQQKIIMLRKNGWVNFDDATNEEDAECPLRIPMGMRVLDDFGAKTGFAFLTSRSKEVVFVGERQGIFEYLALDEDYPVQLKYYDDTLPEAIVGAGFIWHMPTMTNFKMTEKVELKSGKLSDNGILLDKKLRIKAVKGFASEKGIKLGGRLVSVCGETPTTEEQANAIIVYNENSENPVEIIIQYDRPLLALLSHTGRLSLQGLSGRTLVHLPQNLVKIPDPAAASTPNPTAAFAKPAGVGNEEIRTSEAKTPDNLFSSFKINDSDADKNSESGLGSFSFGGKLGGFSGENVKGDTFGGEGFGLGTKGSADDKGVGMGMNDNGGFGLGGAGFAEAKNPSPPKDTNDPDPDPGFLPTFLPSLTRKPSNFEQGDIFNKPSPRAEEVKTKRDGERRPSTSFSMGGGEGLGKLSEKKDEKNGLPGFAQPEPRPVAVPPPRESNGPKPSELKAKESDDRATKSFYLALRQVSRKIKSLSAEEHKGAIEIAKMHDSKLHSHFRLLGRELDNLLGECKGLEDAGQNHMKQAINEVGSKSEETREDIKTVKVCMDEKKTRRSTNLDRPLDPVTREEQSTRTTRISKFSSELTTLRTQLKKAYSSTSTPPSNPYHQLRRAFAIAEAQKTRLETQMRSLSSLQAKFKVLKVGSPAAERGKKGGVSPRESMKTVKGRRISRKVEKARGARRVRTVKVAWAGGGMLRRLLRAVNEQRAMMDPESYNAPTSPKATSTPSDYEEEKLAAVPNLTLSGPESDVSLGGLGAFGEGVQASESVAPPPGFDKDDKEDSDDEEAILFDSESKKPKDKYPEAKKEDSKAFGSPIGKLEFGLGEDKEKKEGFGSLVGSAYSEEKESESGVGGKESFKFSFGKDAGEKGFGDFSSLGKGKAETWTLGGDDKGKSEAKEKVSEEKESKEKPLWGTQDSSPSDGKSEEAKKTEKGEADSGGGYLLSGSGNPSFANLSAKGKSESGKVNHNIYNPQPNPNPIPNLTHRTPRPLFSLVPAIPLELAKVLKAFRSNHRDPVSGLQARALGALGGER